MIGRVSGTADRQTASLYACGDAIARKRCTAMSGSSKSSEDDGSCLLPLVGVTARRTGFAEPATSWAHARNASGSMPRTGIEMPGMRRRRRSTRSWLLQVPGAGAVISTGAVGRPVRGHICSGNGCRTATGPVLPQSARVRVAEPSCQLPAAPSVTMRNSRRPAPSMSWRGLRAAALPFGRRTTACCRRLSSQVRMSRKAPVLESIARRSAISGCHRLMDGEESIASTTSNKGSGAGRMTGIHRPVLAMKVAVASSSITRR